VLQTVILSFRLNLFWVKSFKGIEEVKVTLRQCPVQDSSKCTLINADLGNISRYVAYLMANSSWDRRTYSFVYSD
jgi:hypothetical protein